MGSTGLFNRDTIMRSCMDDGTLLQPDFPATAIDREIKQIALVRRNPGISAAVSDIISAAVSGVITILATTYNLRNYPLKVPECITQNLSLTS